MSPGALRVCLHSEGLCIVDVSMADFASLVYLTACSFYGFSSIPCSMPWIVLCVSLAVKQFNKMMGKYICTAARSR